MARTARIEDTGARLGGARKDRSGGNATRTSTPDKLPSLLDTLWPRPDFRADALEGRKDARVAALFMAVYRNLPARPYGDEQYEHARNLSREGHAACIAFLRRSYEDGHIHDYAQLLDAFGKAQALFDQQYQVQGGFYAAGRRAGRKVRHALGLGFSLRFVAEFLPEWGWPHDARVRDTDAFGVVECETRQSRRRVWRICETTARNTAQYIDEGEHPDRASALEAARRIVADRITAREGEGEGEGKTTRPRVRPPTRPTIDGDAHREGPAWRTGDISPDAYRAQLGFRGVEFGNWLGQAERQGALNASFDAMMDLADLMGLPPRFASLGGKLGIAFGSRGSGLSGAAAHFEPTAWILHFTRTQGAGALAHEFGHGLDYYMGGQLIPGLQLCHAAHLVDGPALRITGRRPPLLDAIGPALVELSNALMGPTGRPSEFQRHGWRLDTGKRPYWGTPTELFARAFEAWVHDALAVEGRVNDYLAYAVGEDVGARWNMVAEPYPRGAERTAINAAFAHLIESAADFWRRRS